jgi:site-specific recombinase XerD
MALRKFFVFASQIAVVPLDPTVGVALVQDDGQAISRPLTDQEINKLLAAAQNGSRAGLIRRDVAILQLILHTGLRVSEIVNLKKEDLIFDNPGMRLKVSNGQTETSRYLPLSKAMLKVLNSYLQIRPQVTNSDYLFLSQGGRFISGRTVQRIVRDCAKSAGLEGVSAQSLRRTFALRLLANCDNLELVSERLGHQSKTITEQYLGIHKQ